MKKILILDDDPLTHVAIESILKGVGRFKFYSCSTIFKLKEDIKVLKPDYIILDIMLKNDISLNHLEDITKACNYCKIIVISSEEYVDLPKNIPFINKYNITDIIEIIRGHDELGI